MQVLRRGGVDRDALVGQVVRHVVAQLCSTRLANTLCIRVECRATALAEHVEGKAVWAPQACAARKAYTVVVQRDLDTTALAEALAHEVRHVVQYAQGTLRMGAKGGERGRFWRAGAGPAVFYATATTDYWTSPWEVEARAAEHLGTEALAEHYATIFAARAARLAARAALPAVAERQAAADAAPQAIGEAQARRDAAWGAVYERRRAARESD